MKILLTNDDGYEAPGIAALCQALSQLGEVTVVAPRYEQSGVGHGITVHVPLRLRKIEMAGAVAAYALEGMPADCVKLGMEQFLPQPDLVVSGINNGINLGTDTLYSGTVSGAMEGFLNGIPAVAVSSGRGENRDYALCAKIGAELCRRYVENNYQPHAVININIPACKAEEIKGYRVAKLGKRLYSNSYVSRLDPMGREYFWLHGEPHEYGDGGLTDLEFFHQNYVTITPLQYDLTNYGAMEVLKRDLFAD